ncbi:MAG: DUF4832 domain-containing protein [Verrucomicrobiales bacterium]
MSERLIRIALILWTCQLVPCWADEVKLSFSPAPAANPLKGLVPYVGDRGAGAFPHSMEFSYVALSDLVVAERRYTWAALEAILDQVAARRHQAVLRVYVEYPEKPSAVPGYLGMEGDPDYEDPRLRACLREFIAAFGEKYDGDVRVGFLTAGLLGKWGEWHTWPDADRWASREVQVEVLDAYEAAFKQTPVLLRYPVGDGVRDAANTRRPFGYHDDSFAWGTLDTGREEDFWFYIPALKKAGQAALEKWKSHPIGGEIRPEAWGICFDERPADPQVQDFAKCVDETHISWLMDSGMFSEKWITAERRERAEAQVRRMGYEFFVPAASSQLRDGSVELAVSIENRGVAPFYANWPIEWGLLDGQGAELLRAVDGEGRLSGILPGAEAVRRAGRIPLEGLPAGRYVVAMRVANPMPSGLPLRFANETQDQHLPGWLSLMEVQVP